MSPACTKTTTVFVFAITMISWNSAKYPILHERKRKRISWGHCVQPKGQVYAMVSGYTAVDVRVLTIGNDSLSGECPPDNQGLTV
jgi:hypothetical protein